MRSLLRGLLALGALILLFLPALALESSGESGGADDPARFTDYRAVFDVASDGTLEAVETLTTEMPAGRHGIFRFWDVSEKSDAHVRLTPQDIRVTLDGKPVDTELSWQDGRSLRVAKIGDADVTVTPGEHVYRISYRIDGAVSPLSAGRDSTAADGGATSAFYWNVVPQGWQMAIERSSVTVHLPDVAGNVRCALGSDPSACTLTGEGTKTLHIRTGALAPHTPVTVRAALPITTPDRVTHPWSVRYDAVLGSSLPVAVLLALLGLVGLVLGWLGARRTDEKPPGFPVMYEPPAGIGPVQAHYIAEERVPSKGLAATLLYQAEQGLTRLSGERPDAWVVEGIGTPQAWAATDATTRAVGEALGVTVPGATFRTDGTVDAGQSLQEAVAELGGSTRTWAKQGGYLKNAAREYVWMLLVAAAVVVAALLLLAGLGGFGFTFVALPFLGFAIGGVGVFHGGIGTRRTRSGRELWSRAGGFRRLLATPSSEERFDFSARKDAYTAFVPWAVAFDCADAWAEKYRTATNQPVPSPVWLYGGYAGMGPGSVASVVDSFESSLSSSIDAYQATQSSSSSSGGGFSGGGGGGGGGGGSW